ncbi:MAG: hypothetical protein LBG07_05975 [Treponema sp.]|jgi:hypothetical protein|nr:hypothetical protein [Treponema sp.]
MAAPLGAKWDGIKIEKFVPSSGMWIERMLCGGGIFLKIFHFFLWYVVDIGINLI